MGNPFDIYKDKQASGSSYGNYEATYERYAKMHAEYDELLFNFNETATSAKAQAEADVAAAQKQIDKANKHAATMAAISGTAQLLSTGASIFSSIKAMKNVQAPASSVQQAQIPVTQKPSTVEKAQPKTKEDFERLIQEQTDLYDTATSDIQKYSQEKANLLGSEYKDSNAINTAVQAKRDEIAALQATADNETDDEIKGQRSEISTQNEIIRDASARIDVINKTDLPRAKQLLADAESLPPTVPDGTNADGSQKMVENKERTQKIQEAQAEIDRLEKERDVTEQGKINDAKKAIEVAEGKITERKNAIAAEVEKKTTDELNPLRTKYNDVLNVENKLITAQQSQNTAARERQRLQGEYDVFKQKQPATES